MVNNGLKELHIIIKNGKIILDAMTLRLLMMTFFR